MREDRNQRLAFEVRTGLVPPLLLLSQLRDHLHGGFVQLGRMNSAYEDGHAELALEVEADKAAEASSTAVVPVDRAIIGTA